MLGSALRGAVLLLLLSIGAFQSLGAEQDTCANLRFTRPIDPGLNSQEKRLACGKGSGERGLYPEWQNLPASQRKFSVQNFLQARGYLNPSFRLEGEKLVVDPGIKQTVTRLVVQGAPPEFDYSRRRHVIGAALTPSFLDGLKSWTMKRLRGLGYGCPKVQLRGDPKTGVVTVSIRAGDLTRLVGIREDQMIPGLMPGVFRRYDAFEMGDLINGDFLKLTQDRAMNDGQVESIKLIVDRCEGDKVYASQDVMAGKPRLISLGLGVNTEGYILARGEWKNVRLGEDASLVDLAVQVSGYEQTFSAYANWYPIHRPSRFYLRPSFLTDHQHQIPYETLTFREALSAQTSLDNQSMGYQFGLGPAYEYIDTIRGSGLPTAHVLFLEPSFRAATHYYDFYQESPRSGFMISVTGDLSDRSALSDFSAQQVVIRTEALWNLFQYSPPLIVFGLRGDAASTFDGAATSSNSPVPPPLRQYLGGSRDLRGFGLLELPENQIGALSSVYGGFETRLVDTLPVGLEPFLFVDVGVLGAEPVDLEKPIYWSPGIGMRLQSPVGNFRATLAHGYLTGNPDPSASHLQAFFSFGEEF